MLKLMIAQITELFFKSLSPSCTHTHTHSALAWGSSVKHNPQKVGKEHLLNDEDVVQVVKK